MPGSSLPPFVAVRSAQRRETVRDHPHLHAERTRLRGVALSGDRDHRFVLAQPVAFEPGTRVAVAERRARLSFDLGSASLRGEVLRDLAGHDAQIALHREADMFRDPEDVIARCGHRPGGGDDRADRERKNGRGDAP